MKKLLAIALLLGASLAQAEDMIEIRYLEKNPGDAPFVTRILVTPQYLRMDSGAAEDDFVLLDRQQRQLFNVLRGSNIAMLFKPGTLPPKPARWAVLNTVEPSAPGTQRYALQVNGTVCAQGRVAKGAHPDAARAMAEMKTVLAATQYGVWQASPAEMQHDCDLANLVWEFGTALELGLPLEEEEFTGRRRELAFEGRVSLQPALFKLPDGMPVMAAPSQPGL